MAEKTNRWGILSQIFWWPVSSKDDIEKHQGVIRDKEWSVLKGFIPENSTMLDVGCGAGDNLLRAKTERNATVLGIDPEPGAHGVGRYHGLETSSIDIKQGFAEDLPFEDEQFDVVFCSHVLEHVNDEQKSLQEMKRVLKKDGVLIIGMPTALMTWIGLVTHWVFTSHIRLLRFMQSIGRKGMTTHFRRLFLPDSHSKPLATSVWYDLGYYRVSNWKKIVSQVFVIQEVLQPYLYPYPDFVQWFSIHRSPLGSSSVFFVCRK